MASMFCLFLALVLALIAGLWGYWRPNPTPVSFGWLAIFFWILSELLGRAGPMLGHM